MRTKTLEEKQHRILYSETESRWDEALPLGNGHFGAMGSYENGGLVFDLNHYDVYYRKSENKRSAEIYKSMSDTELQARLLLTEADTREFERVKKLALEAHQNPLHPAHNNYNFVVSPERSEAYGWDRDGATHYPTARLTLHMDREAAGQTLLQLSIEQATVDFTLKAKEPCIKTIVLPDLDILMSMIPDLSVLESMQLSVPTCRGYLPDCRYFVEDESYACAYVTVSQGGQEDEKDVYHYLVVTRLVGENGTAGRTWIEHDSVRVKPIRGAGTLFTLVLTEDVLRGNDEYLPRSAGHAGSSTQDALLSRAKEILNKLESPARLRDRHSSWWRSFFNQSRITLDDQMMETLWYVNLYSLACSNGNGAAIKRQACGLNGLWDIRPPTQWGSQWYWDVNIQMAFWPIYTTNHLELGEAFYDGLLSYVAEAVLRAKSFYNMRGIASDYPFPHYLCIWPWCAQYFWNHYRHSGDIVFLREKAYPLFRGLVDFFDDYLTDEPGSGRKILFPDVSPEQGPMTQNATITVACVRYLYRMTLESAKILGLDEALLPIWQNTLNRLPDYPIGSKEPYGCFILDSEWAGTGQYMAHGSPLMPIYPIGELNARSGPDLIALARNTVNYIRDNINICTHTFGWEAASLARLGYGNEALDRLYEGGVAFQMRTNGLFAEETERWLQNCLVAVAPVYNPPMMEGGSALIAAINEMLLSCPDDVIQVFPAIPDGRTTRVRTDEKFDLSVFHGTKPVVRWLNCAFENLLCPGGFLVSARQMDGRTVQVTVKSQLGELLKLVNPFPEGTPVFRINGVIGTADLEQDLYRIDTTAGTTYEWTLDLPDAGNGSAIQDRDANTYRVQSTQRTVFLGKSRDTDLIRALEGFTLDFFAGDQRSSKITVYKIDFSCDCYEWPKDYARILPRQFHGCGKQGLDFKRATVNSLFQPDRMFGFDRTDGLSYRHLQNKASTDPAAECPIRGDFIQGNGCYVWQMHLVRGQYQLLLVSGDLDQQTGTELVIDNHVVWTSRKTLDRAGYDYTVVPFAHHQDGVFAMQIRSVIDRKFSLCALLVNRIL